jgi:hypothetical protein
MFTISLPIDPEKLKEIAEKPQEKRGRGGKREGTKEKGGRSSRKPRRTS